MARWLFLILLVLNVLLLAWGYRQSVSPSATPPELPASVPSLRLLSEQAASANEQGQPEPADEERNNTPSESVEDKANDETERQPTRTSLTADAVEETFCVRLGPLRQQIDALDLAMRLTRSGLRADVEMETNQQQSGFWVLIPPRDEEADFLITNLELVGIRDVWRFTKGELAGFVSVGLYSDRNLAGQRLKELQEKDFQGEIRPRTIEQTQFWVAITRPRGDTSADEVFEEVFNQHPSFSYPPPPCSGIAVSKEIP
jgi:hypothetical protein